MKQSNKKTIAFFNAYYLPHLGGVERYTDMASKKLKTEFNVIIVTTNHDNEQNYIEDDGVKIYRLPSCNLAKNRYPFFKKNVEYKNLMQKIKKENIDYVICNTRFYQTTLLGCKIAKIYKAKLFVIDHSSNHVSIGNKLLDFF